MENLCPARAAFTFFPLMERSKDQGCTEFTKNRNFRPGTKELASLKQLLFLSALRIDFLNVNPLRPDGMTHNPYSTRPRL
jgi:hypothetical protein